MPNIEVDANRERWVIRNATNRKIIIGDLTKIPVLNPGTTIDLLKHATREEIGQSRNLIALLKSGRLTLIKRLETRADTITAVDGGDAVTSAEENELVDTVEEGETITSDTSGILAFGEDVDGTAQSIKLSGVEGDELQIINIDTEDTLDKISKELKKINLQMSFITDSSIKNEDIGDQ